MKRQSLISAILTGALVLAGQTGGLVGYAKQQTQLKIPMVNQTGQVSGYAMLKETPLGLSVDLNVHGLKPGVHGIHFHEKGACVAPTFESAGGHFNPEHAEHGLENPKGPHAGDLKNVVADRNGNINTLFMTSRVTLKKGLKDSLLDQDGSALVIHAGEDDQKTNPSGNSGPRVMCGVIN